MALANGQLGGIVVGTSGECVEAKGAEQEREYQCIAREFVEMLLGAGQGHPRFTLDGRGHDLDVLALAPAGSGSERAGLRRLGTRFGGFHVHLMQAGSRDVRQREGWIFSNGAVESLGSPVPGRKHAVDTVAIKRCRAFRYGRKRQIVSVPVHLAFLSNERRTVLHHETIALWRFGR